MDLHNSLDVADTRTAAPAVDSQGQTAGEGNLVEAHTLGVDRSLKAVVHSNLVVVHYRDLAEVQGSLLDLDVLDIGLGDRRRFRGRERVWSRCRAQHQYEPELDKMEVVLMGVPFGL